MRILLIVLNQAQHATYWRALHLGRQLARRGHTVTLMCTSRRRIAGFNVQELDGLTQVETPDLFHGPLRSGWDPWNTLNRITWLTRKRFDLVHAFESRPTVIFPALSVSRRQRIPLVMDWSDWFGRGGSVEERPNPLIRTLLRPVETFFEEHFRSQADGSTVICSTLREKALRLGIPSNDILTLTNGADIETIQPVPLPWARHQTGLPAEAFILGYLGAIFPQDARLLAGAFDILYTQIPNLKLLVAGYCSVDVSRLVSDPKAVIQTGFVDQARLNHFLAACDLFLLPMSDSNANRGRFPLKFTDIMAVGRPVIATEVGDLKGIIAEEPVGLLSQPDPEAFAETTLQLYQDTLKREQMGRHARQVAETRYQWSILAEQLEIFYQVILSKIS